MINPLRNTYRICFELGNFCPYSHVHKKCPISLEKEPINLSANIVSKVLMVANKYDFQGEIAFHTYSEPLVDPRLFKFIELVKKNTKAKILIWTCGWNLTQNLLDELITIGVDEIIVSSYSNEEFNRLSKLDGHKIIKYTVRVLQAFDDILNIYNKIEINSKSPCFAPLGEIIITRDGKLSLCCHDWQRCHTLGNLYFEDFEDILNKKEIREVYNRLKTGDRFLDICKRCERISAGKDLSDL